MFKRLRQDYYLYGRNIFERGLWAMAVYRMGQWADASRSGTVRRIGGKVYGLAFKFSPALTGVYLERKTKIGEKFHIVHAGMIAIHPDAVFGDRCGIMHGVTVGVNMEGGVPKIGNDVFIGCHATVLGEISIGDGARIAANSLVVCDVPAGALAMGVPARIYPNLAKRKAASTTELSARKLSKPTPSHPVQPASRQFRGVAGSEASLFERSASGE